MSYGMEDDEEMQDQISVYEEELSILVLELEEVVGKVYDKVRYQDLVDFRLPVLTVTRDLKSIVEGLKESVCAL